MRRMLLVLAAVAVLLCTAAIVWSEQAAPPSQPPPGQGGGFGGGYGGFGGGYGGSFSGPGPGPGGPGPWGPPPGPPPHMFRPEPSCPASALTLPMMPLLAHANQLGLTDEQWQKVGEVIGKTEQVLRPLRDKARLATKQMREAVLADEFDSKKVAEAAAQAEKAEAAIVNAELDRWKQFRAILTTDQVKTLRDLLGRLPGPMGPGPGPGFGPPPGPDGTAPQPPIQ